MLAHFFCGSNLDQGGEAAYAACMYTQPGFSTFPRSAPLVIANWKMYGSLAQVTACAAALEQLACDLPATKHTGQWAELVYCPPYPLLSALGQVLRTTAAPPGLLLQLGAQNCHYEASGPYTGEVAAPLLVELGCRYVILGHTERRLAQLEDAALVAAKARAALQAGLLPIICVGEERALQEQQMAALASALRADNLGAGSELIFAFEPSAAIGGQAAATPLAVAAVHAELRQLAKQYLGNRIGGFNLEWKIRILYGGSVRAANVAALLNVPEVDGVLVGRVALQMADLLALLAEIKGLQCKG
jgi:triosephosphate isomerase